MNFILLPIFFLILFAVEMVYFKLADKYNIIDHPNHRSSHTKVTIRGGGIVFSLALLIAPLFFNLQYNYFLAGLFLISLISFMDDIKHMSRRIRITVHLIAVSLLFQQLHIYHFPIYWIILGFILFIGTINAINFMDGINGITGGYSLITLITLYYINERIVTFTDSNQLIVTIIALLVFNFFNFRIKAKCFAGDVGSVSIAFIMLFFLLQLIIKTNDPAYLLLLLIYGLDSTTTILFRAIRKENILEPHRSHFYQFLVHKKKASHLQVAAIYMGAQALVNIVLLNLVTKPALIVVLFLAFSILAFVFIRLKMEGKVGLLTIEK
ncbi:MraY family glycosyltransferase [Mucilaginibacter xinganensis]|uniref:UDP-GlcNAc--UDP-phosphate GlcNAc-1-phosphate transferase n=1 Tax=Mucilaginibacter xinganensis TaxID=1234841 RepID=A0A223NUY7_9SPHI|nr:glycosyltransferase family 4 protein [Mucilaginibacter xinganensis]ASU33656.1 UDP-GlcNAc--UDP-phosphate GlcNAc-1-phosphate transferase [Mucilaginibacter xinganensis]